MAGGEFHECMNPAALWRLPALFACENNLYAMGTAIDRTQAVTDLALRASSHGMPAWPVDGMDVLAVEETAARAIEVIRAGHGPCLVELRTYRFRSHSMYDPDRYRDKVEIARWKEHDPSTPLPPGCVLTATSMNQALDAFERELADELSRAIEAAEVGPLEPAEDLTRFVYSERPQPQEHRERTAKARS
ncbi:thiamine pyrophosphate-dependent enzyme [Actinopolymorpha sp. B11F2]|uniref:thiamine pyrophosphate-dependent enzyme n=1 Tax=Actinopolymorpha sp. B11F2 TaxID=3160862 RepID=UPI0032E4136E